MGWYEELPLVKEGESKIVRYSNIGFVAIKLKPTVYSYTYNRAGVVEGSDIIRYECCKILTKLLHDKGIEHTYTDFRDGIIYSKLVYEPTPDVKFQYSQHLTIQEIEELPKFCPIEVVIKSKHVGTPKHRYTGMEKYSTRIGTFIRPDMDYPKVLCRFDWRNPNNGVNGERLCDEVMDRQMAEFWINTEEAENTARNAFGVLSRFLYTRGLILDDICFFISQCGKYIFSEITPDCMRIRSVEDNGSLDKDIWRAGGSSPLLLEKWAKFLDLIKD